MKVLKKFRNWLKGYFSRKFVRLSPHEYYSGIDTLPIYNWWRLHETSDLGWLLKDKKDITRRQSAILANVWESIHDEFFKKHGMGQQLSNIIAKQRQLMEYKIQEVLNDDDDVVTFIDILELEIKEIQESVSKTESNYFMLKAQMEDILKFSIDVRKISVTEFYTYLDLVKIKIENNGN